jgi:hypothetical protein
MNVATKQQSRFNAADALTCDFLTWLADAPRTYAEVMDIWRTSCPRFSIWEDALADGLVQIENPSGKYSRDAHVGLTRRGHVTLEREPGVGPRNAAMLGSGEQRSTVLSLDTDAG